MKVGVTLPQFVDDPSVALTAAVRAEQLGLDGLFCFDHLWPIGQPGRPAISMPPLLGAVAAATSTIHVGTLVARIGLVPDAVLIDTFASLEQISGGRLIAGVGTGDSLSRQENDAYGVPFDSAEERRTSLAMVARAVRARGIPVWVGGGRPSTTDLAVEVGAAVNLWEESAVSVSELCGAGFEVTWGGPLRGDASAMAEQLRLLADAGVTWVVAAWPESIESVAEAATLARRS
ncbi:MAG TPA: LLM class flavin-dependent oxidoreductase [Acidimicrobiales bacterium]|nr:LLM class flavin-dependent oxidoreductase [Acidimicrobiales bacterium]